VKNKRKKQKKVKKSKNRLEFCFALKQKLLNRSEVKNLKRKKAKKAKKMRKMRKIAKNSEKKRKNRLEIRFVGPLWLPTSCLRWVATQVSGRGTPLPYLFRCSGCSYFLFLFIFILPVDNIILPLIIFIINFPLRSENYSSEAKRKI
jgi:hypothetical protein